MCILSIASMLSYIGRFTASAVMMRPMCYSDTFFNFRPWEIQQIMSQVVAYGRLKTIENFKQSFLEVVAYERWLLTRGGRLRVVPSIVIRIENFWYFGKVVAHERWSQREVRLYLEKKASSFPSSSEIIFCSHTYWKSNQCVRYIQLWDTGERFLCS